MKAWMYGRKDKTIAEVRLEDSDCPACQYMMDNVRSDEPGVAFVEIDSGDIFRVKVLGCVGPIVSMLCNKTTLADVDRELAEKGPS